MQLSFELQGLLAGVISAESREFSVGPTEAVALMWLRRGSSPISGVARAVGIRPNGASVLVERLRTRRLVKRQRSRRDNRVVTVELTETGHDIARALETRVSDRVQITLLPLSHTEQEELAHRLGRLLDI
jgi:DNA-binding MarR family transcriptional regulator